MVTVTLAASLIATASSAAGRPRVAASTTPGCSSAIAGGRPIGWAHPSFTHVGGEPFGVAAIQGYAFVDNSIDALDVLADRDSAPHVVHEIPDAGGLGMSVSADDRYLVIADGADGATVVDLARAEAGARDAVLGRLRAASGVRVGGAIEAAVSRDGRYAFVSLEGSGQIAVYRLAAAIADHFHGSNYVGAIPTGVAPVGLAVSPNGRWLYSTSEIARRSYLSDSSQGSLAVISVAKAESDPAHAVLATVSAGCQPVRVAVSPNGADVWVTARGSDALLAFSAAKLAAGAGDPLLANVRVGAAPVGVAVVDDGRRVVVADSDRFDAAGQHAALTIVNASAALAHHSAIAGTVRAEQFPRDMALEPAGTVLLVSNFGSGTLEALHVNGRAQESHG